MNTNILYAEVQKIGVSLDKAALERFALYTDFLVSENKKYNLTAISDEMEILYKHYLDCLWLAAQPETQAAAACLDIGSGAGFPGVVLAIAFPHKNITLLDSTAKKTVFLEKLRDVLGLEYQVTTNRAEELAHDAEYREHFDFVTARAVAALPELCELCLPFVRLGGVFAAQRGKTYADDLAASRNGMHKLGGVFNRTVIYELGNAKNSEEFSKRAIIFLKKSRQTPTFYPRTFARIRKQPLL